MHGQYPNHYPFNLIRKVFYESPNNSARDTKINSIHLKGFYEQISMLSKEQQTYIDLRYKQEKTLGECSQALGMKQSQLVAFESKILRKLHHPAMRRHFEAVPLASIDDLTAENKTLAYENETLKKIMRGLIDGSIVLHDLLEPYSTVEPSIVADIPDTDTPIEMLVLTVRTYNCLKRQGFHTLEDVARQTEAYIAEKRGVGDTVMDEIKKVMSRHGLSFRPSTNTVETTLEQLLTAKQLSLVTRELYAHS